MAEDDPGPANGASGPGAAPPVDLDPRSALTLAGAFVALSLVVALVRGMERVLVALAVALLIALALNPLVTALQSRARLSRISACAVVLGGFGVALVLAALLLVPPAAREAADLPDQIPEVAEDVGDVPVFGDDLEEADAPERVDEFLDDLPDRLTGEESPLDDVARGVVDVGAAFLLTSLLAITLLLDGERLVARGRRLVPVRYRDEADRVAQLAYEMVGRYVAGSVFVAVMAGTYILILGLVLGVPLAPLAAGWITMTNLIPQIGGALGGIPFVLLGLTAGVGTGLACAAGFLINQQIENHLIQPLVVGRVVKLSPPVTMAAALIGVSAAGVLGALMAVPAIGAAKAIFLELRPPPGAEDAEDTGEVEERDLAE